MVTFSSRLHAFISTVSFSLVLFSFPVSENFKLQSYSVGGGGGDTLESEAYGMQAVLGETAGPTGESDLYGVNPGLSYVRQAAVPSAPTLENSSGYYNRLKITITPDAAPSDTIFAVAISTDGFVTTDYVLADSSVGDQLTLADYRTYAEWGGASGTMILGLQQDTTYEVKVKAMQGSFTESAFGPSASASTAPSQMSFDIDVSSTDEKTTAPYTLDLGILSAGSVIASDEYIWFDIETNGDGGAFIYAYSSNNGLYSARADYTISSITGNLDSLDEGFGAQAVSATGTGGPLVAEASFANGGNTVGQIPTSSLTLFHTSGNPIESGRASIQLKAKASTLAPASTDYTELITVVASASF